MINTSLKLYSKHKKLSEYLVLNGIGDSVGAWGVRKMTSTPTNLANIRRDNDDAVQDVGVFGTYLSSSSIDSFVGANSAYGVTLYDQVGSNDLTQSTPSNQPRVVNSGVYEQGLHFGLATTYLTTPDNAGISFTNALTIHMKFRLDSSPGSGYLITKSSSSSSSNIEYGVRYSGSGENLSLYLDGSARFTMDASSVSAEQIHYVTFTWDGTTIKCYFDKAYCGEVSYNVSISNSGGRLDLGALFGTGVFEGIIYNTVLFNRALLASEISML